jgi:hypothetical protein
MNRLLQAMALSTQGLSIFRRGLGLLCLLDAGQRLTQATLLYSDLGVLPRSAVYSLFDSTYSWSLYFVSGQPLFAAGLLLLTAALGLAQMLGGGSRPLRIALWVLMVSVQNRHPGIVDSADDLLRVMLFWDIFLPDSQERAGPALVSLATLGWQCQLTVVLVVSAVFWALPHNWMLAAQWGNAVQACRVPWLGSAAGVAVVAVWWAGSRSVLLPLVGLILAAQAVLMHPVFPLTLAVALSSLSPDPRGSSDLPSQPRVSAALRQPKRYSALLLGWLLLCLIGPLWLLLPRPAEFGPLAALGGSLGLRQDWTRSYPLARPLRAQVVLRPIGFPKSLYNLDLRQGRRLRLMSQAFLQDLRLVTPMAVSFAERDRLRTPVAVWLKIERFSPGLTLPRQEIRQLDSIRARAGLAREEENSL